MRKGIIILGISTVFMFSLVACGSKETVTETTESTTEDIIAENVDDSEEITTEKKKTSQKETTEKTNEDNNEKTTESRTTESTRTSVNNNSTNSNTETSRTNERTTERTTESRTTERPTTERPTTERPTTEAPTTQHTHNWQPITRHHDAVYETRVTPAVVHYWRCDNCGCTYPSASDDPCYYNGNIVGGSCQVVISPYREEQVLVQEAYDEIIGYRCSCGATK